MLSPIFYYRSLSHFSLISQFEKANKLRLGRSTMQQICIYFIAETCQRSMLTFHYSPKYTTCGSDRPPNIKIIVEIKIQRRFAVMNEQNRYLIVVLFLLFCWRHHIQILQSLRLVQQTSGSH